MGPNVSYDERNFLERFPSMFAIRTLTKIWSVESIPADMDIYSITSTTTDTIPYYY